MLRGKHYIRQSDMQDINTTIDFNIFGKKVYKEVKIPDPIGNHMMRAVKKALK